jgi:hypothetical protein
LTELLDKPGFPQGTLADEILYRIQLPLNEPEHMPLRGSLNKGERSSIQSYLDKYR